MIPASIQLSLKPKLAFVAGLLLSLSSYAGVKISGTILHPSNDSIQFTFSKSNLAYLPVSVATLPDKNGRFSLQIPELAGTYTQTEVRYGNHLSELLLSPGDSLHITLDANDFDNSLKYAGRGADIQDFLQNHIRSLGRINQYSLTLRNFLRMDSTAFINAINNELKKEDDFVKHYKKKLPTSFKKYWYAFHEYYNYFFIQQYPVIHEAIRLQRFTDTIPSENFVVLKHMPLKFDDDLISVPSYLLYLTAVFDIRLKAVQYAFPYTDTTNRRVFTDSVYKLAYQILPDKSLEYFTAQNLYAAARIQPIAQTRLRYAQFKTRWPHSEYMELLNTQVTLAERLAPGMPAPNILLNLADGTPHYLSDYSDTVVYLAFWATWCKQCLGEMRQLQKKVIPLFTGKPVKFIFVSLDDDTAAVSKLVEHFDLPGTYAYTKGSWRAAQATTYGVQALPAYYLIDTKGKLAPQNPPSPQFSTELIIAISKLY